MAHYHRGPLLDGVYCVKCHDRLDGGKQDPQAVELMKCMLGDPGSIHTIETQELADELTHKRRCTHCGTYIPKRTETASAVDFDREAILADFRKSREG